MNPKEFESVLGKTIQTVTRLEDSTIEVHFTDGTSAVIGAVSKSGHVSVDFE